MFLQADSQKQTSKTLHLVWNTALQLPESQFSNHHAFTQAYFRSKQANITTTSQTGNSSLSETHEIVFFLI